jgi:hypothetical protein
MTRLLLDYPWTVSEGLGLDSAAYKVILDFLDLLARTGLDPVPFIDHAECSIFWDDLKKRKGQGRFSLVIRFLNHCTKNTSGICLAYPMPEPTKLRDSWKRALHDELNDLTDWRNPQLIIPTLRHSDWEPVKNETAIHCEPCNNQPASTHHRVLAVLERYESHPFAISDLDPWDLQRIHPPNPEAPRQHPALLPKPLIPKGTTLENLNDLLNICRGKGWEVMNNYYCFIPPADFDPLNIDKDTWRKGRAFRYEKAPSSDRYGPEDYNGIVWSWDEHERHWDVQTKPKHMRISHTGKRLRDPD